jgi:hypothetical protein
MDQEKKPRERKTAAKAHKIKDNIFKTVFDEPRLFVEFLKNFVPIDILKDITPDDIEDITPRHLPLFSENKDSDTVKRINFKGDNLFVISILEHESEINYKSSFKMLVYIAYVLEKYVKENDKKYHEEMEKKGETHLKLSTAKEFEYPPVLPIVFYDGAGKWTSEIHFAKKTKLREVFEKYIPKFEYELVSLNDYSKEDLVKYNDVMSLIMLIDKVRDSEDMESMFSGLPTNYVEALCDAEKIPPPLLKIVSDCIMLLLKRAEVPKEEIEAVTEKIYARKVNEMFEILDGYSVTKTRIQAKKEARAELKEEVKAEVKEEVKAEVKEEVKAEVKEEVKAEDKEERENEKRAFRNEIKRLKDEIKKLKSNTPTY